MLYHHECSKLSTLLVLAWIKTCFEQACDLGDIGRHISTERSDAWTDVGKYR